MSDYSLQPLDAQKILAKFHLGHLSTVEEMSAGLINPVYLMNDAYILRIELHRYESNPDKLKRESILFQVLPNFGIPTPKLIGFDDSLEILDTPYIVLNYLPGENMEKAFGGLNQLQQKSVAFQLGELAKKIHTLTPQDIQNPIFGTVEKWVANRISDFEMYWLVVKDQEYLTETVKTDILSTFTQFQQLNLKTLGRLTHGDFSASNIQIHDGNISGIFDFEFAGIADPLWDLRKLSVSYQLGELFDRAEFLRGYGKSILSPEEKIRVKMYSYQQGVWEIWANLTHFMPSEDEDIAEGQQILNSTRTYRVLQ